MTILQSKICSRLPTMTSHIQYHTMFFGSLILTYCFVVNLKASGRESGFNSSSLRVLELSAAAPWSFCVALSQSVLTRELLYCSAMTPVSIIFSLLNFVTGYLRLALTGFKLLTLNTSIQLPLFWSTWGRARCPDLAICAGIGHGQCNSDYSQSHCCTAHALRLGQYISFFHPAARGGDQAASA